MREDSKGRSWRKAVVWRADDHAGSESLVDIAVVPEGEGAGLSARIVDHAAARPPRSRARPRRRAPVPGEHENGRRASSCARLVLRAIERQDVEGIPLDFVIMLARVQDIEIGNTVNPKDDSFAINTEDNEKSFANVSEVTGNSRIKMEGVCKTK
jgi:hypothetical protein